MLLRRCCSSSIKINVSKNEGLKMKKITLFFAFSFIGFFSYASSYEICLNAVVSNSPMEYSSSLNVFRKYGARALYRYVGGHASVSIYDKTQHKTVVSYGYHPDGDLWINSPNDIPETMLDFYNNNASFGQFCLPAKQEYFEHLEELSSAYYETYGPWAEFNNCVNFAGRLFSEVTGDESLNPQIPLPTLLLKRIEAKKEETPEEIVTTEYWGV